MQTLIKKLLITIFICNPLFVIYGQESEFSQFITTKENAILYAIPNNTIDNSNIIQSNRELIILSNKEIKRLRKPTVLKIIGLRNSKTQLHYDTYEIEYKNKRYYIPKEFVNSNSYIDSVNHSLENKHNLLTKKKESLTENLENQINNHKLLYNNKITELEEKIRILPYVIDSVEQEALTNYKREKEDKFNKSYNLWYKRLPTSTKNAIKAISISEASLSAPNSAGGCDYILYYTNKSKKTIKYLYWDGWVYNAVNDVVECEIRGGGYVSGKDTGPVTQEEESGGIWECVIYNYSAKSVKLSSIEIQYMDNSRITIQGDDIRRMLLAPEMEYISWDETDSVKRIASATYKKELKAYNDSLSIYKDRLFLVNTGQFNSEEFIQIQQLKEEIKETEEDIKRFNNENFLDNTHNSAITENNIKQLHKYEKDKEQNKKVAFGTGLDLIYSGKFIGTTIPLEIIFGSFNQFINFSISGDYTFLHCNKNIYINKLDAFGTLHLNIGKDELKFPLSVGIGYSANLGKKSYEITGSYFNENHEKQTFSYPILVNKNNIASIVSLGIRTPHWKFSLYARFDITPTLNKSLKDTTLPKEEYLFYDDYSISKLVDVHKIMPLFGFSTRYYF